MASHNYDEISGIQKAAILLISLGPEKFANIFRHLKEDEIETLVSVELRIDSELPLNEQAIN